jgi:hypothetical protein
MSLPSEDAIAQRSKPASERNPFERMPQPVKRLTAALGDRARAPGKERIVLAGQLSDDRGAPIKARVILQLPDLVRLEGFRAGNLAISFDGEARARGATQADESLLETFAMDTAEGMLRSIQAGAYAEIAGLSVADSETGRPYDIYEVISPVRTTADQRLRSKHYFFDSQTGYLAFTRYSDGPLHANVEVRFSEWRVVEGSAYPGRIDRLDNGRPTFSFIVSQVSAGPRSEPAEFR